MKKKILLVDDERAFTEMLRLNLEATGLYDVVAENNALYALPTAIKFRPDIILMDIVMTNQKGTDLAAQFKKSLEFRQVPIVFLTATVSGHEPALGEDEFMGHPVIPKPTDLNILLSVLEENLSTTC